MKGVDPWSSTRFGAIDLANRIIMAPLTRARAGTQGVPNALMADYYAARADAGLILSEATGISRQGLGFPDAPGIWTQAQRCGWRQVTDAVHRADGKIMLQLWHMGRMADPAVNGMTPVSPSAIPGFSPLADGVMPVPHVLEASEIAAIIGDYRTAALHAIEAGFDGVQIHAANGYLIDCFLRDSANHRQNSYGGSPQGRTRLLLEVTDAVADAIGGDRTAIRLSPALLNQGCWDSDPAELSSHLAKVLGERELAFVELRDTLPGTRGYSGENWPEGADRSRQQPVSALFRSFYNGSLVLNGGYERASAFAALAGGAADAISFGRPFIANPDLVRRLRNGWPLADSGRSSWYAGGAEGYTDYPPYPDRPVARDNGGMHD